MGFAEGLAAGSGLVRNTVGAFANTQDAIYRGKVYADNVDQMGRAKQDREFEDGLKNVMGQAARMTPTQSGGEVSGMDMAADGTKGPTDDRQTWQKQADAYAAGRDYALQHGKLDRAADLVAANASTRTRAAQQLAQTGLRSFMAGGDASGLLAAFNAIDDGVQGKSVDTLPDGTLQFNMIANGKPQAMPVTREQVPGLIQQYFDPASAYDRQVKAQAAYATKTFETNEEIRKNRDSEAGKERTEIVKQEGVRMGQMPKIETIRQGEGQPDRAFMIAPTNTGYSTSEIGSGGPGGAGASGARKLTKQDQAMYDDISKTVYQGTASNPAMMDPATKVKLDEQATAASNLYDANANNPSIGAQNPQHWASMAKAIQEGKTKPAVGTRPDGTKLNGVEWNGVIYAAPTIPYNSPANARNQPGAAPTAPTAPARTTPRIDTNWEDVLRKSIDETDPAMKQEAQARLQQMTPGKARTVVSPVRTEPVAVQKPATTAPQQREMPANASQAAARGTIAVPNASATQVQKDSQRLAAIDASLQRGGRADPALMEERSAIVARLNPKSETEGEKRQRAFAAAGVPIPFSNPR